MVARERRWCGCFLGCRGAVRICFLSESSGAAGLDKIPRMRAYEYRVRSALTLVGLLLGAQSLACEPPVGFVNPALPDIAPLEELLAHTEQIDIARSLAAVMQAGRRPLSEGI